MSRMGKVGWLMLVAVLGVAIGAGCGGDDDSAGGGQDTAAADAGGGSQQADAGGDASDQTIKALVRRIEAAVYASDAEKYCELISAKLAAQVVDSIEKSTACEQAMKTLLTKAVTPPQDKQDGAKITKVTFDGDRAVASYQERDLNTGKMVFVKEDGQWKLDRRTNDQPDGT